MIFLRIAYGLILVHGLIHFLVASIGAALDVHRMNPSQPRDVQMLGGALLIVIGAAFFAVFEHKERK